MRDANLCYLLNKRQEVLLQFKRQGFGQGKWNGPGGKVEAGETIEQAVAREVKEETGLRVSNLKKLGELEFYFDGRPEWNQRVHVFSTGEYRGQIRPSEEGELRWFKIVDLPLAEMWEDDRYWLPDVLAGKSVAWKFYFNHQGKLAKYEKI